MMAFHHRKFLISSPKLSEKFATDCYLCYVCPENCYLSPPPPEILPPPPPPPLQFSDANSIKSHVPTVLIMMLCILGVAFLILSYLTLARYRRRRNPNLLEPSRTSFADESQGPVLDHPIWYIRTVGLPQSAIDSIASFPYTKAAGVIDGNDCAVCLNDFRHGEALRLLPKCSHAFHLPCIDTWLRSHKNCPVCRAPIFAADGGGGAGSCGARPSPVEPSSSGSGSDRSGSDRDLLEERAQGEAAAENVAKNAGNSKSRDVDGELQGVRRSVSMDLSKSSVYRVMKSGSSSMKRSLSFSGKRSVRKNGRSPESEAIELLEIDLQNYGR